MSKLIKYIKELAKQILLEVISMIIALIKGIYVTLISIYKRFKISSLTVSKELSSLIL